MKRKLIIISIILAATSVNAQTIKDPIQWNQNTTIDTPISVLIDRVDKDRRIAGRTHQKLSNEPRYRSPFIGDLTRGTF